MWLKTQVLYLAKDSIVIFKCQVPISEYNENRESLEDYAYESAVENNLIADEVGEFEWTASEVVSSSLFCTQSNSKLHFDGTLIATLNEVYERCCPDCHSVDFDAMTGRCNKCESKTDISYAESKNNRN